MQQNGSKPPEDAGGFDYIGEIVWIPETLVVSPARGRFRREPLVEGAMIEAGTVIGHVAVNGSSTPVGSASAGVFLGWLAWEGEALQRGTPLARIGSDPSLNGDGPAGTANRRRGGHGGPTGWSKASQDGRAPMPARPRRPKPGKAR